MKAQFIIIVLFLFSVNIYSQKFSDLEKIPLKEKGDYMKVESELLDASDYLLNKPLDKDDVSRYYAIQFIMRWMEGTPDYTFSINSEVTQISKKNDELMAIFFAAMTKYVLENKENANDEKIVRKQSLIMVLEYIENPKFVIKQDKNIKKYINAKNEGKLDEVLK